MILQTVVWLGILLFNYNYFQILLKKIERGIILIALFWLHLFSLVIYTLRYVLTSETQTGLISNALQQLTPYTLAINTFFGIFFTLSLIFYRDMLSAYNASEVMPFMQITTFICLPIFYMLGVTITWANIIGSLLIFFGALIFAMQDFNIKNIPASLRSIPKPLFLGGIGFAISKGLASVGLHLATYNAAPKLAISIMNDFMHVFPFSFYTPFELGIGLRIVKVVPLFLYLHFNKQYSGKLFKPLAKHKTQLVLMTVAFLVSLHAFEILEVTLKNSSLLAFIDTLNIPIILFLSKVMLNEKVAEPTIIIGTIVTMLGSIFVVLFS